MSHDMVCCLRSMHHEEHKVIAIAARTLKKAESFAREHNIPKAYGTYEELANDDDVEVVYVATVNIQHFRVGKLFLTAGKHVLMEKPMTMNARQTRSLIEIARNSRRFLMEAIWSRFFPVYKQLLEELRRKTIGSIYHVNATLGTSVGNTSRITKKEYGGGAILDLGIYCINAVCMVYAEMKPKKIVAVGNLNNNGVDENVAASLLYDGGKIADIAASVQGRLPGELVICGTEGILKIPFPMWCPTTLYTPSGKYEFPLPELTMPCNFLNSSGLYYQAQEVRRCIQEGLNESPHMTHGDSLLLAEIMDEIQKQLGVTYK